MKAQTTWQENIKKIFGQQISYIKHMVKDYVKPDFDNNINEIKKDSGKVLVLEGKKVAVYKDPAGELLKLSPVCRHLGCIVTWNDIDKTWDCPCHGSRYTKEGKVLNGPTKLPLKTV